MAGAARKKVTKPDPGMKVWMAFLLLVVALGSSAIAVVFTTHRSRYLLNELQQLENQRNELQVVWGQLLLEQSSLVSQGRIEDIAIAELGMEVPEMGNIVVIRND